MADNKQNPSGPQVVVNHYHQESGCCLGVSRYTCGVIWACIGVIEIISGIITAAVSGGDPAAISTGVTNITVGVVTYLLAFFLALRHGPHPQPQEIQYAQLLPKPASSMPGQLRIEALMGRLDTSIC
jgi:hypothetical protein